MVSVSILDVRNRSFTQADFDEKKASRTDPSDLVRHGAYQFPNFEYVVAAHYESLGYFAIPLFGGFSWRDLTQGILAPIIYYLEKKYPINQQSINNRLSIEKDVTWEGLLQSPGVPDFVFYKRNKYDISEVFFAEVKTGITGINFFQSFWQLTNDAPLKIIHSGKTKPIKIKFRNDKSNNSGGQ